MQNFSNREPANIHFVYEFCYAGALAGQRISMEEEYFLMSTVCPFKEDLQKNVMLKTL